MIRLKLIDAWTGEALVLQDCAMTQEQVDKLCEYGLVLRPGYAPSADDLLRWVDLHPALEVLLLAPLGTFSLGDLIA